MVGEAFAGLSALKTAFDLAKGLKNISDAALRNAAVIDLQEKILTAQAAQSALTERIGDLEEEVARHETWTTEQERYELTELSPRVFAYVVKEAVRGAEPTHWLCAQCYQSRKKSLLQSEGVKWESEILSCNECAAKIRVLRPGEGVPNIL